MSKVEWSQHDKDEWERGIQQTKIDQLDLIIEKLDRLIVLVEKLVPDAENT